MRNHSPLWGEEWPRENCTGLFELIHILALNRKRFTTKWNAFCYKWKAFRHKTQNVFAQQKGVLANTSLPRELLQLFVLFDGPPLALQDGGLLAGEHLGGLAVAL